VHFSKYRIEDYEIVDVNGKIVVEAERTDFTEIIEGKTTIVIPISELPSRECKLLVGKF